MMCLNEDLSWSELVYYDVSSPSRLRWKVPLKRGRGDGYVFKNAHEIAGTFDKEEGYWEIFYRYRTYKLHRIVWELLKGNIPENFQIDHLDGNRSNNNIENLRCVPQYINARNRFKSKANKSGLTGVSKKVQDNYVGWSASWMRLDGKLCTKTYSIKKYGDAGAFEMAKTAREDAIKSMKSQGSGYEDRHGIEERLDKTEADSYTRCVEQLEAAKQGGL